MCAWVDMNNGLCLRSMRKDGGRRRARRCGEREIERERGKIGAGMPEASLKSLRVSISALGRDKDEEDGRGEGERKGE